MIMTESQRDILEIIIDLEYPNLSVPKSSYILELLRQRALNLVNPDIANDYIDGRINVTDDDVLEYLKRGVD